MSIILSIINALRTLKKIRKKIGKNGVLSGKHIFKLIVNFLYPIISEIALIVIIIAIAFYMITGAVGELFNGIKKLYGSSSQPPSAFYENISEEDMKRLVDESGANLNPKKVSKYIKKEVESVPSSISGTKIIETGEDNKVKNTENETVTVNTTSYVDKYKLNWEFVAAVDIALFNAHDIESDESINKANTIFPVFDWNKTYSRDTTDFERNWTEVYEYDPTTGKTVQTKNTYNSSKEIFKTVKEPLAIPNKVETLFGIYNYSVREDVVIKDSKYSNPYVIKQDVSYKEVFDKMVPDYTKPIYKTENIYIVRTYDAEYGDYGYKEYKAPIGINTTFNTSKVYDYIGTDGDYYVYENGWWIFSSKLLLNKKDISANEVDQRLIFDRYDTEEIFTGKYKEKKQYKTITVTQKTMKKTKQKIVEDKPNNPSLSFQPTKFIQYLNYNKLSVKDIDLLREVMLNLPNGNSLMDNLDRIAKGTYGDIGDGNGGIGGGNPIGGYNFMIPLFIQWDTKWANNSYAGENIGLAGCAPTSMAMVITGLGGNMKDIDLDNNGIVDPSESAQWSTNNGYAAYMQGSYDTLIPAIAKKAELTSEQTYNADKVYQALKNGKVAVANVMPGTIINGHHFLVLTGVNADGSIRMNDPNSKVNSEKGWSLDTIKRESKNFWIIDNPKADIYDPSLGREDLFIAKVRRGAIQTYYQFGVLPSITIAQGIEESGWGETKLATQYNNLFGIKADSSWKGEKVALITGEDYSNVITAYFRVYNTWAEGIFDHGLFIYENSRYTQHGFFKATDYRGQSKALQDAGYATLKDQYGNPIYSNHINNIIETYRLHQIDEQVKKTKY